MNALAGLLVPFDPYDVPADRFGLRHPGAQHAGDLCGCTTCIRRRINARKATRR